MSTPWFIGGGAEHSPAIARLIPYALAGDVEGIVSPHHFKVRATSTPSNELTIDPGGAIILNRSPGGDFQSYIDREDAQGRVTIAQTGGTARTDLIVRRIEDPQFAPWSLPPEADPATSPYAFTRVIPNIPAGIQDWAAMGRAESALVLAKATIPANTATITNAMVTDLRYLALPKSHLAAWSHDFSSANTINTPLNTWTTFLTWSTNVPRWATRAFVSIVMGGAIVRTASWQGSIRAFATTTAGTFFTRPIAVTAEPISGSTGARFVIAVKDMIENIQAHAGYKASIAFQFRRAYTSTAQIEYATDTNFTADITWLQGAI